MAPRLVVPMLVALSFATAPSWARTTAPGDTASTVVLSADFNSDTIGLAPDTSLPGNPSGDFLTLNQTAGTIRVVSAVDGLTTKPVQLKQASGPGGVEIRAWTAAGLPGAERATVRWRSLAKDDNPVGLMQCIVRSATGQAIASVDYRPHGELTYNMTATLPVSYTNNKSQQFTITVDFTSQTTSLAIDETAVAGFQAVPFQSSTDRVGSVSFTGDESHPQTLVMDDISVVVFTRDPDRAPSVTAPVAFEGEERGTVEFPVSASDPDGDAIESLTVDASALPTGSDAALVAGSTNGTGVFQWHPKVGEAGSYVVIFTATAHGATASATTQIGIAPLGTSITGTLIWTPVAGQEGSHLVTFTAVDSRGDTNTATTEIFVTSPNSLLDRLPVELSPGAIQKGPVVSAPRSASATVGSTVTVTATAIDTTGLVGGAAAPSPRLAPARAASITLTADLTLVPGAIFVVDQDPVLSGPAIAEVEAGSKISFNVGANDPDGDALLTLDADLTGLPPSNDATFTPNPSFTSGLFQWTPGVNDSGSYDVSFTATNNLVGSLHTRIHVHGAPTARVFLMGNKRIRLSSNKATDCIYLEPVAGSFDLDEVDPTTVRLVSEGTGVVDEIPAISGKTIVIGDKDGNLIRDAQFCFVKSDLRLLFGGLKGNVTVPVTVEGRLVGGQTFRGVGTLAVNAGNGGFLAAVTPNPLNPMGTLRFNTRRQDYVTVRIYDMSGRLVRELWSGVMPAGDHEVTIDGRDRNGASVGSGIYFYRIEADGDVESGRFAILK
jgi:flagellar hook capping protein FlgD/Big-like domain-containing protein